MPVVAMRRGECGTMGTLLVWSLPRGLVGGVDESNGLYLMQPHP
jgi:hypothetical protein